MPFPRTITSRVVIRGESFDGCDLQRKVVRANFVECTFNGCHFSELRAEDAFWGAANRWTNCTFSNCDCSGLISPQNRFEDCTFVDFAFTKFRPCETAFINTTFDSARFTALKAQPNSRNPTIRRQIAELWPYPEIAELHERRASVLFRKCTFASPRFQRAYFNHMVFDSCQIQSPELIGCSFFGIQNLQNKWWTETDQANPEYQYVLEIQQKIGERLGMSSTAFQLSQQWLNQLPTSSSHADWFDYLLNNAVPDDECDVVERLLDETPNV